MSASVYLIQLKTLPRKGKPNGDKNWSIDWSSKPFEKVREAKNKAKDLQVEFPQNEFRAKLYWEDKL